MDHLEPVEGRHGAPKIATCKETPGAAKKSDPTSRDVHKTKSKYGRQQKYLSPSAVGVMHINAWPITVHISLHIHTNTLTSNHLFGCLFNAIPYDKIIHPQEKCRPKVVPKNNFATDLIF